MKIITCFNLYNAAQLKSKPACISETLCIYIYVFQMCHGMIKTHAEQVNYIY